METKTITYKAKLVALDIDCLGYTNYVFENLNNTSIDDQYVMCVRFPNWEQKVFNIEEEGFVTFRFVEEGIDQWYDGKCLNKYKHTNFIFLKFIPIKPKVETTEIILD